MARLLKTPGSNGPHANLKIATFDGRLRDGATFSTDGNITDGDMILFKGPAGLSSGINVNCDNDGLHAMILVDGMMFRIGIERVDEGLYEFRPAPQHIAIVPALSGNGEGVQLMD